MRLVPHIRAAIPAVLFVFCGGCAVEYPPLTLTELRKNAADAPAWRELEKLSTLSLGDAQRFALDNNPDLASTRYAVLAARDRYHQALGAFAPEVRAGVDVGQEVSDLDHLHNRLATDLPYYDAHLNEYETLSVGYVTDDSHRKAPMTVFAPDGEQTFTDGFSLCGHGAVKYYLNRCYSRFRFGLALPSRVLRGQTEHTKLDFTIETDDRENPVYSEDILYNGKVIIREEIRSGFALKWFEADITDAVSLIISARATPWTDGNGLVQFSIPDLVIAEPRLYK